MYADGMKHPDPYNSVQWRHFFSFYISMMTISQKTPDGSQSPNHLSVETRHMTPPNSWKLHVPRSIPSSRVLHRNFRD